MSGEPEVIGLVGLGVMGRSLALNLADHGCGVVVHNRTPERTREFLDGPARGTGIRGAAGLGELVALLPRPRRVVMMVQAGPAVDDLAAGLSPLLEDGDILVDGGNSHHLDTARRVAAAEARGLLYVGLGVSGGEEGARHGPSLMPGGSAAAWPHLRALLRTIAARAPDGEPCCEWIGPGGAGHFVKMVHNGIEYGDMQLIAEAYDLMRSLPGMPPDAIAGVFAGWNRGRLQSYLVEITATVLARREEGGGHLVDRILDVAEQKGTGRWTVESAMELGVPLTLIGEAVFARCLSALKEERVAASATLGGPPDRRPLPAEATETVADLEGALYLSKLSSYAQGFTLLREASRHYGWGLDPGRIALIWRGGCIIRAALLDRIASAFTGDPGLASLLMAPAFREELAGGEEAWRRTVLRGVGAGVPLPVMGSALAFLDGYRRASLPANLLQALRDFFGAHTFQRTDRPRGEYFHADWTAGGGAGR
jgi:6-phosphogluconate dehydrogenase